MREASAKFWIAAVEIESADLNHLSTLNILRLVIPHRLKPDSE